MNKFLKYTGISVVSILALIYVIFLIAPFFLNGLLNSYSGEISKIIEESSGYKVKLDNLKILTTPKLTAGAKVGHIDAAMPNGESFLTVDNVQGKISLIPIILRKIEIDVVSADNLNINLKVKKDGKFLLEDYIPQSQETEPSEPMNSLPFGFKLSNKLPNIVLNNYNISFVDIKTDKSYSIYGEKFSITDFILNKKVKVNALGHVMLEDKVQFNYDVKLLNKIMPDVELDDLVFSSQASETEQQSQDFSVNIIDIFKLIYQNQITADLDANVKTSGTLEDMDLQGVANITNISAAVDGKKLPAGNFDLNLNGHKIKMYSKLFTAEKEITEIIGNFQTGKHPHIDLNFKSNAKIKSVIDLVDSFAKSFGYKDFDTLTATGGIDADFSLKSDMKKINSSGYFKIPSASLNYGLYNVAVNDINADVDFSNNIVNIKQAGLSILNQPLKLYGTINQSADADINIVADRLGLKGLLLAAGQLSLLKENAVNSGTISMNTSIKGRLDKIVPKVKVSVDNVNLKNLPSNTTVTLSNATVNLTTDGKTMNGGVDVNSAKVINPVATVSLPIGKIVFGQKDLDIQNTYILFNNSRIDITGKVADYMSKNISFNLNANGALLSSDVLSMLPKEFGATGRGSLPINATVRGNDKAQDINFKLSANPSNYVSLIKVDQLNGKTTDIKANIKLNGDTLKFSDTGIYANNSLVASLKGGVNDLYKTQKLDLNVYLPSNVDFVVPGFNKSKGNVGANINITGGASNPILKGSVSIPSLKIPEIPLDMNGLQVSLNGPIARGNGTLKKFATGGIVAENLSSDFNLLNDVFYLKNLTGDAFDGKINGNISYNISNGHIGVDFKGAGMNAEKAIAGAAGLKNALSGKLGFTANVTLHGATDVEMMKNLKGKVTFEINDGAFGNIGRFENFLFAENLQSNSVIKAAVNSVAALPAIKKTAEFKTISGVLNFDNGWAQLNSIKTSGPSMAYYITGRYNLLNATANVTVLGRISAEIVSLLGPLGDLSVSKLTSYIPKFGTATGNIINALTSNPKGENIAAIPQLSSGNKNYKDFKVLFNGGVESRSSVKSFKWLSVCDTSEIESLSVKDQIKNTKQAVQEARQQAVTNFANKLEEQRKQAQESKQQIQNATEGLKNLLKF